MKVQSTMPTTDKSTRINLLFLTSKLLLSQVNFYEDEVQVLKNLLRKNFQSDFQFKAPETLQSLYGQVARFERQKINSLNSLFCHQSNIKATSENMMQLSDDYLVLEHSKVAEEVKNLQRTFELLKQYFFRVTRQESKKDQFEGYY